jgi:hypothetical protein
MAAGSCRRAATQRSRAQRPAAAAPRDDALEGAVLADDGHVVEALGREGGVGVGLCWGACKGGAPRGRVCTGRRRQEEDAQPSKRRMRSVATHNQTALIGPTPAGTTPCARLLRHYGVDELQRHAGRDDHRGCGGHGLVHVGREPQGSGQAAATGERAASCARGEGEPRGAGRGARGAGRGARGAGRGARGAGRGARGAGRGARGAGRGARGPAATPANSPISTLGDRSIS